MPAWEEYLAGTDPTNPSSRLAITNIVGAMSNAVLVWGTVSGRYYAVLTTTNLLDNWADVPDPAYTNLAGTDEPAAYTNTDDSSPNRFFRIRVWR